MNRCETCALSKFTAGQALGLCTAWRRPVLRHEISCNLYQNRDRIEQKNRRAENAEWRREIEANV